MRTTKPLKDFISEAFPDWLVLDEPRKVDAVNRPTAVIYPQKINRQNVIGGALCVEVESNLWLLTEKEKASEVEVELDRLVFDLLGEIENRDGFAWSTAERAGLEGAGHGWNLTVITQFQITPLER